jgi:hypothetical protein
MGNQNQDKLLDKDLQVLIDQFYLNCLEINLFSLLNSMQFIFNKHNYLKSLLLLNNFLKKEDFCIF